MIGVGSAKKRSKDNPGIGAGAAGAALGCADLQNIGDEIGNETTEGHAKLTKGC